VVDGLKGFPEAITSVFPQTLVQTCIVHLIRYSMHFASWKERRRAAAALKPIYQAAAARERREDFDRGPLGVKICGDRPKLAAQLGAGDPVLRLRA
jgi:putative transposase